MNDADLALFQARINKEVVLRFRDGEFAHVRLLLVAPAEGEIVYKLLDTDHQKRYDPSRLEGSFLSRISEVAEVDGNPLSFPA